MGRAERVVGAEGDRGADADEAVPRQAARHTERTDHEDDDGQNGVEDSQDEGCGGHRPRIRGARDRGSAGLWPRFTLVR
ncbi:hypothetical protein GCM10009773_03390 [Williamsia serinedens]